MQSATHRFSSQLASVIDDLLRRSGKSARRASLEAGLDAGYVKDILAGKNRNPSALHLGKLAPVLGTTIEMLVRATFPTSERPGDRLRRVREFLNIQQIQFAEDLGMDADRLARIENGQALLPADAVMALKAGYGISADWVLDGSMGSLRPDLAQWLEQQQS